MLIAPARIIQMQATGSPSIFEPRIRIRDIYRQLVGHNRARGSVHPTIQDWIPRGVDAYNLKN
jgi:hypothetical protein